MVVCSQFRGPVAKYAKQREDMRPKARQAERKAEGTKKKESRGASAWLVPAIVLAVTCVTFLPALHGQFVNWDDDHNFLTNPFYRGLGWPELKWMFTTFLLGPYQPLSWLTLGLDFRLWGMNPYGYHLTNLL